MINLNNFFTPKSIAVVGASRNPNKVGHVITKNLIEGGFLGRVIPVNKNADAILNLKSYKSVLQIKESVDLAIIAVPAEFVLEVIKECSRKKIKDVLIVTAGFGEVGDNELENKLKNLLNKKKMRCIGVNCLGIFDAHNHLDSLFLPRYRMDRPEKGGISFVCQSGAVGSAILDIAAKEGNKFSKFISYGNATQIDESDLIEYLGKDEKTKVICLYVEGVKDGEKFFEVAKKVGMKKPIIVLKGGLTDEGQKATLSHTGSLAGKKEVYYGVFNQINLIRADSLEEMFHIASLIEKEIVFDKKDVLVITNGGGYGILSTDRIAESENLGMAELSRKTLKEIKKFASQNMNLRNPLDLLGDASTDMYREALRVCVQDENVGAILLIVLYQTPLITTEIVEVISEARRNTKKPLIVVSTGGDFTEILSRALEEEGVPVFSFPNEAVSAMDKTAKYWEKRMRL
jgi:acetate---CoA ligase (ADP-forming)